MRQSLLIFRHYFRRAMLEPFGILILTGLPVLLIAILEMVFAENMDVNTIMVNGYNMVSTQIAVSMFIMFQFFGGNIIIDWLHMDFKTAKRWRLYAAPCPQRQFILPAGMASWIFSIVQGVLILIISATFFNAYLGNLVVLIFVLIAISAMGQLMYMLLFLLTEKKSTAEGIAQVVIWGMTIASGWLNGFERTDSAIRKFFLDYGTPVALARRTIHYSGFIGNDMTIALQSLSILISLTVLMGIIVIIVSRRRWF